MLKAVKQSEETHIREQEQARARDEQLRSVWQTDRSGFNYFMPTNSTPIRNDNARTDPPGVYFNTNPTCHVYSTTSDSNDHYEPPVNDSIIQTAVPTHADQLTTNMTRATGRDTPWRRSDNMGATTNMAMHRTTTGPTSRNGLHNNISPNSSDNRNGPMCFRCGEHGHIRLACRERVICDHCKTYNHSTKACRKQLENIPSPQIAKSQQVTTQQQHHHP